ncbi:hypothetical protein [Nocardia sp. NPDC051463]|uniref:hypothetical protein n=1 Tax=Nocardia sp. NPDC051463 TaxID=3154845 RepID=UPI0034263732
MLRRFLPWLRESLFFLVLHLFSGWAIVRKVHARPDLDTSPLELVEDMLRTYAESLSNGQ